MSQTQCDLGHLLFISYTYLSPHTYRSIGSWESWHRCICFSPLSASIGTWRKDETVEYGITHSFEFVSACGWGRLASQLLYLLRVITTVFS